MTAYEILLRLTFILLSLLGLYTCVSFGSEKLGRFIKPLANFKPVEVVCGDGSCIKLEDTWWAHIVGVPNWWFGIAFYLLTLLCALWTNVWVISFGIVASTTAIFFSLFLIYGLVFKLKTVCRLCYIAHATNAAIFITWVVAIWQASKIA